MWEQFDTTLALWLDKGDVIEYDGDAVTIQQVEEGDDCVVILALDKMDDEVTFALIDTDWVGLLRWNDGE